MNEDTTKSIKIAEPLHRQLRILAAETGCKLNVLTEQLMIHALSNSKEEVVAMLKDHCAK